MDRSCVYTWFPSSSVVIPRYLWQRVSRRRYHLSLKCPQFEDCFITSVVRSNFHSVRSGLGSRLQIWFTSCRRCIASSCSGRCLGGTPWWHHWCICKPLKPSLIPTETRLSSFGNATHFLWMHLLFPSLVSYKGKTTSSWHHYRPGCSCSDQPWTPKCLKVIRLKCGGGNSSKMKHCWLCLIQVISICDHKKNPAQTCFLAWGGFLAREICQGEGDGIFCLHFCHHRPASRSVHLCILVHIW